MWEKRDGMWNGLDGYRSQREIDAGRQGLKTLLVTIKDNIIDWLVLAVTAAVNVVAFIAGVVCVLCVILAALDFILTPEYREACESGWKNSGVNYKWEDGSGCILEVKPGVWIPAENYTITK